MGNRQIMKILTIIPAKTDSTRLPKKNIQKIKGKTLVEYSIDYAKQSKYNPTIVVSSESDEVLKIALDNKVIFVERPVHLLKDAEVTDVYIDLLNSMNGKFDLVVCLQPDNPNRSHTFDECIQYMIDNNYDDLVTVNPDYKRSGSVRIFKFNYLKKGQVSKRLGCIKDNAIDIHYQSDLEKIKKGK
jgi:CMP-N,N'-diacetyllegionaminic acid synthase